MEEENKTTENNVPQAHNVSHEHNNSSNYEHKNHEENHHGKSGDNNRTLFGILSYLGPLVIISYFVDHKDSFIKFHIKQGFVLLVIHVILWIITPMFFWHMWGIVKLVNLGITILSIIGIINVIQKKEKMLPLVGSLSSYFKF